MDLRESFYRLSPERILDAAEASGFHPTGQFQQLNSLENRVYSLSMDDNEKLVFKFYRPGRWSLAQLEEEHVFLSDLAAEDFPVCSPLPLANAVASVSGLYAPKTIASIDGIYYAAWAKTGGRIPDEFTDDMLSNFGTLLARLHTIGAQRAAPGRPIFDAQHMVLSPLEYLIQNSSIPSQFRSAYESAALGTAEAFDRSLGGKVSGRIHGDCHWGNLLYDGKGLFFLDFDDFATGPAVQDLWMIAPATDDEGRRQRDLVLDAYRVWRDFDADWLSAVDVLRAARSIHYAAWIARRIDDPAFVHTFPNFGDSEYWETETRDLVQMTKGFSTPKPISRFVKASGKKGSGDPDGDGGDGSQEESDEEISKLTNKDYFYDM